MKQPTTTQNSHLFKPGESGNPGGRPKSGRSIVLLARKHTKAAMNALIAALKAENEHYSMTGERHASPDHKTRIAAAIAIHNRGFGKPMVADALAKWMAQTEGGKDDTKIDTRDLTDDQLARMLKIARENLP